MRRAGGLAAVVALILLAAACSVSVRPVGDSTPTPAAAASPGLAAVASPRAQAPSPTPAAGPASPPPTTPPGPTAPGTGAAPTPTPPASAGRPQPAPPTGGNPAPAPMPTPGVMPPPETTPTPVSLPACDEAPVRGFGLVWHDQPAVAQRIGCPLAPEFGVAAWVQTYAQGLMVWLDIPRAAPDLGSASWVVTLAGGAAARHRVPDPGESWDPSTTAPSGAFAWVWENVYTDRERLGPATSPPWQTDAALQRFERGTMLWLREPGSGQPTVYVVDADLAVAAHGAYQAFVDRSFL
ncbi:MAG: hypothetical protein QJR03_05310 [Sphaerobacter sp.]|nr:hypothetical protein [Sphaerobacter sp.]